MNRQKPYEHVPDEELIGRLREGEAQITDFIMDKYKGLVRAKAQSMYILGADREDLIQEGMIGLFKAIRDYDTGRDASFRTFADLCVSRQMYSAIESMNRKKHMPLNTYISLSEPAASQEAGREEGAGAEQLAGLPVMRSAEEEVLALEDSALLRETMERLLSPFERKAAELMLTGMTCTQIAKVLNRDVKSTDNALTRAKRKLRKSVAI
ncbi:MAG: sigma-70 family RNA polymerase sigma factor [Lachnospiraceae bacterium]|nr:sigma-70 family RNA polymerase sigma factor [Lachnospiraceae bacterium]